MITPEIEAEYNKHIKLKEEMRNEKDVDKSADIPVVCFDLQNVMNCPKSEIGP